MPQQPVLQFQLTLTSVATAAGGQAVYQGTITGGGSNAYVGLYLYVSGFPESTGSNNSGSNGYYITNSSAVAVTVQNPNAVNVTSAALGSVVAVNNYGPENSNLNVGASTPFGTPPAQEP